MGHHLVACAGTDADQLERAAVAAIWGGIEQLMIKPASDAVRHAAAALPAVTSLSPHSAPDLAQLHVRSATSMMTTIRTLVPAAFPASSSGSSPDPDHLAALPAAEGALVATLIELQLLHLRRAAMLLAHSRAAVGTTGSSPGASSRHVGDL